jgi:predicted ATPase
LSWELRTAISLARRRLDEGRKNDAREMLTPVHDRFSEGFATRDLRMAKRLTAKLA